MNIGLLGSYSSAWHINTSYLARAYAISYEMPSLGVIG